MSTAIALKDLVKQYKEIDIINAANRKYTLFYQDFISLTNLITNIRSSTYSANCDRDIVLMVAHFPKGERTSLISYGGFLKNGKHYKFTEKNCCNVGEISCCNVVVASKELLPPELSFISEYIPQTELDFLAVILLSINAFSPEIIDCYFDGDGNKANPISYILALINNSSEFPINDDRS